MIETVSLLYLASAMGAGMLAVLAVSVPVRRTRTTNYFALFCGSVALWAAGAVVALNVLEVPDPMVGDAFSGAHTVALFMGIGVALAPTFWLLFALNKAQLDRWLHGMWLGLIYAQAVFAFLVITTNPYHHLAMQMSETGAITIGPLGVGSLLWAWAYGFLGLGIVVRSELSSGTPSGRHRAGSLVFGALVVIGGSIIWAIPGIVGEGVPTFNPAPALFLVLAVILSHDVLRYGFTDVVHPASAVVFETVADAVIVTDEQLSILAVNPAAREILPHAEETVPLQDVSPELGRHAAFCMQYSCDDLAFEANIGDAVYWGRVRRTASEDGLTIGSVLILTDLTDLRDAQKRLLEIGRTAEGEESSEEYVARVMQGL